MIGALLLGTLAFAVKVTVVATAILFPIILGLRYYGDNGLPIPLSPKYYARRWMSPKGKRAEELQKIMKDICMDSVGEVLPHRALHDARVLSHHRAVMVVYERKTNEPCMFHLTFKADYVSEIVVHLGLVMVAKAHQGKHLQRYSKYSMIFFVLSYLTIGLVLTDIADSPSNTKLVSDSFYQLFPSFYHNVSPELGTGPEPWQLEIAQFMLDHHRQDFGTSRDATFNQATFVVKGSNSGADGSSALTSEWKSRRSRNEDVNQFVKGLLGEEDGTADELFHVSRANLWTFFKRHIMRDSALARRCFTLVTGALLLPGLLIFSRLARHDVIIRMAMSFMKSMNMTIHVIGKPVLSNVMYERSISKQRSALWVSNHFSWLDYPILVHAAQKQLRAVVSKDASFSSGLTGRVAEWMYNGFGCIWCPKGETSSSEHMSMLERCLVNEQSIPLIFGEGTSQVQGPPLPLREKNIEVAFKVGAPVQPVAIWYSQPLGQGSEESPDILTSTSNALRHPTQCLVNLCDPVFPQKFSSVAEFISRIQTSIKEGYDKIAKDRKMR